MHILLGQIQNIVSFAASFVGAIILHIECFQIIGFVFGMHVLSFVLGMFAVLFCV